ncbi:matrilin-1-like [Mytilus galloprovincialis]|uniref:matrilin-1-like n=1 Tax=Mytilus galloprovincialis TaxID=29158 RepID=UPI003F7C8021
MATIQKQEEQTSLRKYRPVCKTKIDLAFVIDSSASIRKSDFRKQIKFVNDFVDFLDVGSGATRVAAVSFSNDKFPHFGFNDYTTKKDVLSAINYIQHSRGPATRTYLALKYTHEHIFAPDNGERSDVIDVVIVLTDGHSQRRIHTQSEAALIKDRGAFIFAIGVGRYISVDELNEISSDPDQKFTILVSSFSQLNSDEVKEMLLKRACFETMECQTGSKCPPGNGAQNVYILVLTFSRTIIISSVLFYF